MTRPVLVVAAAGNVGRAVVSHLLEHDLPVRAADIDTARVEQLFPTVETVRLDLRDAATFTDAVRGVGSMFLLRPPPIARVGPTLNALVDAGVAAGVNHVVFSSVAGADDNRIVPHHRVETHLRDTQVGHTILRPGFYAQNLATAYGTDIRDHDRIYVPAGDGRVAFIDVRDLGQVAAAILADPTHHIGAAYELTGPQALHFAEVAALLSESLDRPIRYEPATALGYARHLRGEGLPVSQVIVQTLLHLGLRRGDAETVDPTLEALLGRPPRTLQDYIDDHAETWTPTTHTPRRPRLPEH